MARKSNDLFTMLQFRRRGLPGRRSGGRLWNRVTGFFRQVAGVPRRRSESTSMPGVRMTGAGLAGLAFLCLGVGYLLGDTFPWSQRAQAALRTAPRDGVPPGPIGLGARGDLEAFRLDPEVEVEPLTNRGFFVAVYGEDQRQRASGLALYLRSHGVETARPYLYAANGASSWVTLVYYDGPQAAAVLRDKLLVVPGSPDFPEFDGARKATKDWPLPTSL